MTLLSRLNRNIREHNWFAVCVEFVIVVIGVAVGFQLTQGYDQARLEARETSYLTGMATDFSIYQSLLICRIETEGEIARGLDHVITAIGGTELSAEEQARAHYALTLAHAVQPGLPLEGNLQALVLGDLVETIRDDTLRGRILQAQSTASVNVAAVEQINAMIIGAARFDAYLERARTADSGEFYTVIGFDDAAMADAPGVRDLLMNLANYHRAIAGTVESQLSAVTGVLNQLDVLGARDPGASGPSCLYGAPPTRDID